MTNDKEKFQEIAADWDHSHRYSPAPRHRRKIIMNWLNKIKFSDCLDAGCAQPYLLEEIVHRYHVKGYGCDISTKVIASNRNRLPQCEFLALDMASQPWPEGKQFDLVISSEVVEHIEDWQSAVKNLAQMAKRYLLITVPSGKVRPIDKMLGHYRHFQGDEIVAEIGKHGFKCLNVKKHGFPIHSLYKRLINAITPEKIYESFSGGKEYSFMQKIFSQILYLAFYIDYFFSTGNQLFILAERQP